MSLDMLHPEDRPPWTVETMERFATGDDMENATNARLAEIGPFASAKFTVEGQQERFEIKDRDGTVLITGKIDGKLRFQEVIPPENDGESVIVQRHTIVYEVKNTSMTIRDADDVDRNRFTRHWPDQILSYALAKGVEYALLIVRKSGELPAFILYKLEDHLDRAESFLRDARCAIDGAWSDESELPDFTENISLCRRCPHFGKSCVPPRISLGEGMNLIADPEFEADLVDMIGLEDQAKRYEKLKKSNSGRIKELVGELEPEQAGETKLMMIGDVVAKAKVMFRKGNPNPKPTSPTTFVRVTYEKATEEGQDDA
jgi:hypothetical protein